MRCLPMAAKYGREHYCERNGCQPVEPGFAYNSGANPDFLTVDQLRDLIRQHIDPAFEPF
jgi:UDP-N-acetylglucosamine 4,6-dehydratase/5-epimerase